MHATFARYEQVSSSQDEVIQAGRRLAAVLSAVPGFISYALVEMGGGALATVSVFETQVDQEEADRRVAAWVAVHATVLTRLREAIHGEILVQKGM